MIDSKLITEILESLTLQSCLSVHHFPNYKHDIVLRHFHYMKQQGLIHLLESRAEPSDADNCFAKEITTHGRNYLYNLKQ